MQKELAEIFYKYGEEPRSRALARAIVAARQQKKITTTGQLCLFDSTILCKANTFVSIQSLGASLTGTWAFSTSIYYYMC